MVTSKIINFFKQYKKRVYKKGEMVKSYDENPKGVFCLQKGAIRCIAVSKDGIELTINVFKPISFFPMAWVINNTIDLYAYEAISDVEVFIAPKESVEKFLKENPDVTYDLLKRIYRGLEGYFLRMESLLSGDAYIKTIVQIVIHTKRFGVIDASGKYLVDITHAQLASLSGLSRETITREIKKLENKKLVMYKGKQLIVLDLKSLEKEVTF
ncbi:MAG TPA: Crp/Fnr family transcriptional regulator [Patescibacteria group bacterium]